MPISRPISVVLVAVFAIYLAPAPIRGQASSPKPLTNRDVSEAYPPSNNANCDASIYTLRFGGYPCTASTTGSDVLVRNTLTRWGNWNAATSGIRWDSTEASPGAATYVNANSVPATHVLPTSFYHSTKPAWFGNAPFPVNGPDVTGGVIGTPVLNSNLGGHANNNPAANMYYNIMHGPADGTGGVLAFDGSLYYIGQPTFDHIPGAYTTSINPFVISSRTPGATICYRTDGVDPAATTPGTCDAGSTAGTVSADGNNQASFTLSSSATVKALATKAGFTNSAVTSNAYTFVAGCADPVISGLTAVSAANGQSATITWTTDVPSDSMVAYGSYNTGFVTPLTDTAGVTSHSVTINGLRTATYLAYVVRTRKIVGGIPCGNGYIPTVTGSITTATPTGANLTYGISPLALLTSHRATDVFQDKLERQDRGIPGGLSLFLPDFQQIPQWGGPISRYLMFLVL